MDFSDKKAIAITVLAVGGASGKEGDFTMIG